VQAGGGVQTDGVPVQVSLPEHVVGQVMKPPQPLLISPQMGVPPEVEQAAVVSGTHAGCPQTEGVPPPPQVSAPVHAGKQV
jgi:hypothetical protein